MHHGRPVRARGFTLVELLVVVGVIALLIGMLLPALSSARQSARLVASMSNMRQITVAAVNYSVNNGDNWPVIPVGDPKAIGTDFVAFNSWNWGGKTSDAYWKTHGAFNYILAKNRVLNPWVYPDLELRERVPPDGIVKKRKELEIFRCPSDIGTYQRGFGTYGNGVWTAALRDNTISSYDDVGTSYHLNVKWWYASERPNESMKQHWERTQPMFRRGGLGGPSKFVWCYDQIMDVVVHHEASCEGDHGGLNRCKASFMDGHITYLHAEPGEAVTTDYWLHLE